jgi:hypothetical protein
MYTIIRADGTEETVNEVPTINSIQEAIHCGALDIVFIGKANKPARR